MAKSKSGRFKDAMERLGRSWGTDVSTPLSRAVARLHLNVVDHGILRGLWTNREEIAPGVWRSNQPGPGQLARFARRHGIRTVLNLRGAEPLAHYLFEEAVCARMGLELVDLRLSAKGKNTAAQLLSLLDQFDSAERPMLIHCKSGADRTGLASAFYLMHVENKSAAEARSHLSWRYMHQSVGKTGHLDAIMDLIEADMAKEPMTLRRWLETRYDQDRVKARYRVRRGMPPKTGKAGKAKPAGGKTSGKAGAQAPAKDG